MSNASTIEQRQTRIERRNSFLRSLSFRAEARFYNMLLLAIGMYLIAASIGSGWVLFLATGLLSCCILAAALPLLAFKSISLEISGPDEISAGEDISLVFTVQKHSPFASILRWLILQSELSAEEFYGKPERKPILLEEPDYNHPLSISCPALRRGMRKLPALALETSFPFGIIWCKAVFQPAEQLIVLPRVESMEGKFLYRLRSGVYVPGDAQGAPAGFQSCCSRGVRLYTRGDSRRYIHWSLSARHGRLMVRELEQEGLPAYDVVFDSEAGWSSAEQFELAVSAAASILQLGHSLGIHPDLFLLPKIMKKGDELQLRSADIDEQLRLLASLVYKKPVQKKDTSGGSEAEAFESRTRAVVLVTPFSAGAKTEFAEDSKSRSSVFVLKVAATAAAALAPGASGEFVLAQREDFAAL